MIFFRFDFSSPTIVATEPTLVGDDDFNRFGLCIESFPSLQLHL